MENKVLGDGGVGTGVMALGLVDIRTRVDSVSLRKEGGGAGASRAWPKLIELKTHPWGASHNDLAALPFRVSESSASPMIVSSASVASTEILGRYRDLAPGS